MLAAYPQLKLSRTVTRTYTKPKKHGERADAKAAKVAAYLSHAAHTQNQNSMERDVNTVQANRNMQWIPFGCSGLGTGVLLYLAGKWILIVRTPRADSPSDTKLMGNSDVKATFGTWAAAP
uniref:Uncharacterized protein n=1 Tax=Arundo donax TaxID=35708 RepID=A0A0A9AEZ3_ARUDO